MRPLLTVAMVLALLAGLAGCGQSACDAHPNGLACEQEQSKHKTQEEANRTKEEENTPQAKEERSQHKERENQEFMKKMEQSHAVLSGEQVAEKVTAKVEPSGRLGGNEKFSCPEGKYTEFEGYHLVCTLTRSNGSQEFEVTSESGTVKVNVKGEGEASEAGG